MSAIGKSDHSELDPFYEPLHNAVLKFPEDAFQPNSHLMFVALPQLESVIQA
jgi:hypothetical protein